MTIRRIKWGLGTSAAAIILLATGFFIGRYSMETPVYDAPMSPSESQLVGRWHISSNVSPKESMIEFRSDRTAVKYLDDESQGMVMTWGQIRDQLSMQNAHNPGEEGDYVPPSIFHVIETDEDQIELRTWDGHVEWILTRA